MSSGVLFRMPLHRYSITLCMTQVGGIMAENVRQRIRGIAWLHSGPRSRTDLCLNGLEHAPVGCKLRLVAYGPAEVRPGFWEVLLELCGGMGAAPGEAISCEERRQAELGGGGAHTEQGGVVLEHHGEGCGPRHVAGSQARVVQEDRVGLRIRAAPKG